MTELTPPSSERYVDGSKSLTSAEVAARLERLPMTSYQWWLFVIIATAWLFDSMDLAALTFILAPISSDFNLSGTMAGALATVSFGGMIVGASFAGVLGDRFGRRPVFTTSMIVWGVGSLVAALSWDLSSLLVARLLIGLGMGAEFPVAQAMLSEFVPARNRGKFLGWLEGFWPIGFIVCGALALFMVPSIGWRSIFYVLTACSVFALIIRWRLPESPRWFVSVGRLSDAERTLRKVEAKVQRASGRPLPPVLTDIDDDAAESERSLRSLFSSTYRKRTVMMWLVWFCTLLGYYGITTWMGKLLADSGMSIANSIEYVVLMALWGIPGFLLASWLLDKIGRKPVISGFIFISAIAAYVYSGATSPAEVLITGSIMQFFFFGMWSALYAYTPEVFPSRARATGCGTSSAFGRAGAMIGPLILPLVMNAAGVGTAFIVVGCFFVLGGVLVLVLGPETRNKVLEEV